MNAPSRNPLVLGASASALALAAALVWLGWPVDSPIDAASGVAVLSGPAPGLPGRAAGMAGGDGTVEPARLFELGAAGDLRIDLDTKAALDMIVADLGTHPSADALAQLESSLRSGLPREAAEQALALVHGYRAYATALAKSAASQAPPRDASEMRALLAQDSALQRAHFDPDTAQALFGVQEAYSRYAVEAQAIDSDPRLSALDKARQRHALRAALPPEVVELEPGLSPRTSEMELRVAEVRDQGGTAAQVQAIRTQYLGKEAAASMGEMEAQTTQWAERYAAFRKQKNELLASSPADPAAVVDRLLAQHFSAEELPGVRAYDRQAGR